MEVLVPIPVVETVGAVGQLISTTVATEDATAAWTNIAYVIGDERHVVATHRVYRRTTTGTTNVSPELDTTNWKDVRPTNKWAIFDGVTGTRTSATTSMQYKVKAGFFNAVAFFGLVGANNLNITVQDGVSGPTIYTYTTDLDETQPGDWYDYFFGGFSVAEDIVVKNIPPYADAYITFTISGLAIVKCGMFAFGDLRPIGLTQYGASGAYTDYSYIGVNADTGENEIRKRSNAKNMQASCYLNLSEANTVQRTMRDLLAVPAVYVGKSETDYEALRVFGLGSGRISYDGPRHCILNLDVKGLI